MMSREIDIMIGVDLKYVSARVRLWSRIRGDSSVSDRRTKLDHGLYIQAAGLPEEALTRIARG